ncbi:MAG: RNA-splicing factor [Cirrosporium novae-zelandiae]|nr:MAG: RNA-splicing factor [Cirrosporium novae-zelandiae]
MESAAADPLVPQVTFKKRKGKSNFRKRPATPPPASDPDSEYSSFEDEDGQRIKRRRKTGGVIVASKTASKSGTRDLEPTKYTADRSAQIEDTNDATKQSNWYDEDKSDELSAKNLLGSTRPRPQGEDNNQNNGTYKGASNYQNFIQKNANAPTKQVGPMKAPTNIRTITVTDFAPDVCKDYKQTGYCGFGDSCKFLHAREDYKQGWELDRDWEINTKGKKVSGGTTVASANRNTTANENDDADDEALLQSIPFACIICKGPYKNPIITKCGHYFCESCALQRYRKTPSCAACGTGTGGVFNQAKRLNKLLERKRERARKRREEAIENGEEVSDEEEELDEGSG